MRADEPLDSADYDAVKELEQFSLGWALVRGRIEHEIKRRRDQLETDLDAAETAKCRGRLAALRDVLNMPEFLKEEAKSNATQSQD